VGVGLGVVRVINYVYGKILCELVRVGGGLYRGIVVWIKVREAVWVVEWVWEMVKTIFFRLGKCSESFVNASIFSDSTGMSIASFVSKPIKLCKNKLGRSFFTTNSLILYMVKEGNLLR
jgi:hypothetical protein